MNKKIVTVTAGIRKKKPLATKTVIIKSPSTVMKGRTSSLLREALLLPQRPLPKAYVLQNTSASTKDNNNEFTEDRISNASSSKGVSYYSFAMSNVDRI